MLMNNLIHHFKCEMIGLLLRVLRLQPKTKGVSNSSFYLSP